MAHHLVGLTEIADLLGVSRQRVIQLAETDGFPEPEVVIAAGRVWRRAEVEAWARRAGRLPADRADPPGQGRR